MNNNTNINHDLIINILKDEFTEIMNNNYNYYKILDVKISKEQYFVNDNDRGKHAVYIVVKFGEADVNFGQSVLPMTINIMAEQVDLSICQDLLTAFAEKYDLKRTQDATILQIYKSPQNMTNFYEVFEGFKNILILSGTLVISQNANLYTISLYDENELTIEAFSTDVNTSYQPIENKTTFFNAIANNNINLLSDIMKDKNRVEVVFDYKPLDGNEIKEMNISTLLDFQISKITKYDNIIDIGDRGFPEVATNLFDISISQTDTENNVFILENNIVEFNDNFNCIINNSAIVDTSNASGYYLIELNNDITNSKYANKGLLLESIPQIVVYVSSEETGSGVIVTSNLYGFYNKTTGNIENNFDQIIFSLNSTFDNSWEMKYKTNPTVYINDITDYGFKEISLEETIPNKVTIYIFLKPLELEKYDYKVPYITTVISGNFQLDTQAFYNNNNFTESQTQVGTRVLSITTFLLDDIALVNKVLDIWCEDIPVNTSFCLSVDFRSGRRYFGMFKLSNFTGQQNIAEIPVYNVTLTN